MKTLVLTTTLVVDEVINETRRVYLTETKQRFVVEADDNSLKPTIDNLIQALFKEFLADNNAFSIELVCVEDFHKLFYFRCEKDTQ